MMKFERPPQPSFLQKNYKKWGKAHKAKRDTNPSADFQWRVFEGKEVNQQLLEALEPSAKSHCAFCDGYPLGSFARQTLEHFRPKSQFPRLVYVWWNLFICCDMCQKSKGEKFDRKLLKPDQEKYEFNRYFMLDYSNGQITPNPAASPLDQERAEFTIEMYQLNNYGRPKWRMNEYKRYTDLRDKEGYSLDVFPYRFFLE